MAGNPYYGTNPYFNQSSYPWTSPQFQNQQFQNQQFQTPQYQYTGQTQQPQAMTPPTVHAEIIQAKSIEDVERFPVNAGTTQLFQLADDSAFVIKSVLANGEAAVDVYEKRPRKPAPAPFDPSQYVTREELEERLAGLARGKKRAEKPDAAEPAGAEG